MFPITLLSHTLLSIAFAHYDNRFIFKRSPVGNNEPHSPVDWDLYSDLPDLDTATTVNKLLKPSIVVINTHKSLEKKNDAIKKASVPYIPRKRPEEYSKHPSAKYSRLISERRRQDPQKHFAHLEKLKELNKINNPKRKKTKTVKLYSKLIKLEKENNLNQLQKERLEKFRMISRKSSLKSKIVKRSPTGSNPGSPTFHGLSDLEEGKEENHYDIHLNDFNHDGNGQHAFHEMFQQFNDNKKSKIIPHPHQNNKPRRPFRPRKKPEQYSTTKPAIQMRIRRNIIRQDSEKDSLIRFEEMMRKRKETKDKKSDKILNHYRSWLERNSIIRQNKQS